MNDKVIVVYCGRNSAILAVATSLERAVEIANEWFYNTKSRAILECFELDKDPTEYYKLPLTINEDGSYSIIYSEEVDSLCYNCLNTDPDTIEYEGEGSMYCTKCNTSFRIHEDSI